MLRTWLVFVVSLLLLFPPTLIVLMLVRMPSAAPLEGAALIWDDSRSLRSLLSSRALDDLFFDERSESLDRGFTAAEDSLRGLRRRLLLAVFAVE
jgi:hypothetical protein